MSQVTIYKSVLLRNSLSRDYVSGGGGQQERGGASPPEFGRSETSNQHTATQIFIPSTIPGIKIYGGHLQV